MLALLSLDWVRLYWVGAWMVGGACTTLCHVDFAYLAGLVGSCLFCFCFFVFMGGAGVVMNRSDNGVSGSWLLLGCFLDVVW